MLCHRIKEKVRWVNVTSLPNVFELLCCRQDMCAVIIKSCLYHLRWLSLHREKQKLRSIFMADEIDLYRGSGRLVLHQPSSTPSRKLPLHGNILLFLSIYIMGRYRIVWRSQVWMGWLRFVTIWRSTRLLCTELPLVRATGATLGRVQRIETTHYSDKSGEVLVCS